MLGGPSEVGLLALAGVKLAGYSAAGYALNRIGRTTTPHAITFGVSRTLLGLVAGVAFIAGAGRLGLHAPDLAFYLALAPVRMGEWLLLLWLFYARRGVMASRTVGLAAAGSAWSYLLDLPALLAVFYVPGGFWIS